MKKNILYFVTAVIIFLVPCRAAADTIYTWTDEHGVRHMTNIPPVESRKDIERMELEPLPQNGEPGVQYIQPEIPEEPANETAIAILDNHVIVPVSLSYQGREITANLLLDTGSAYITLHKPVARKLLITKSRKGSIRVAGGEVIEAEAVTLDRVSVGPHTRKNLIAGIIENRGPEPPFDGLLGMNFLKNYQYTIDFENKVLRWDK